MELRGLSWPASPNGATQLACTNCAGLVQFESLTIEAVSNLCSGPCSRGPALDIASCSQVFVASSTLRGNVQVQSSHVVFDLRQLWGEWALV